MRVVIAEDSLLVREGLRRVIVENGMTVVAQAQDGEELLAAVEEHEPDVVVTDIKMPPTHRDEGLNAAVAIRSRFPRVGILVLSQYIEAGYAMGLLNSGDGIGYMLKDRLADIAELIQAIRRVAAGGTVVDREVVAALMSQKRRRSQMEEMTPREREILGLMAEGWSNAALCEHLFLSAKTVETHVGRIFRKLGLLPAPEGHRRVLAVLAYLSETTSRVWSSPTAP